MKSQDPAAAAAAAAMATMAVGGIQPTDPRIQPFMRIAKEEYVNLQVQVLVSNGMSEAKARQRAEKSLPTDRFFFFGQALMKYVASFSSDVNASSSYVPGKPQEAGVPHPFVFPQSGVMPTPQSNVFYTLPAQNVPLVASTAVTSTGVSSSTRCGENHLVSSSGSTCVPTSAHLDCDEACQNVSSNLNLSSLQRLFQKTPAKNVATASTAAASTNILAPTKSTVCCPKSTRFDVPLGTQTTPSSVDTVANVASSVVPPKNFAQGTLQYLDEALQQWTYCVYSVHHTPPAGMDSKVWRTSLFKFVNFCVTLARQTVALQQSNALTWRASDITCGSIFPSWITSCAVPTVEQVLTPRSFVEAHPITSGLPNPHLMVSNPLCCVTRLDNPSTTPRPPPTTCRQNDSIPPPPEPQVQSSTSAKRLQSRRFNQVGELSPVSSLDVSSDHLSDHPHGSRDVTKKGKRTLLHGQGTTRASHPRHRSFSRCSSSMLDSSDSSSSSPSSVSSSCSLDKTKKGNVSLQGRQSNSVVYPKENLQDLVDYLNKSNSFHENWLPIEKRPKKNFLGKNKFFSNMVAGNKKDMLVYIVEEKKRREDRSRRFFPHQGCKGSESTTESANLSPNVPLLSPEGLRLMTWEEKLTMLNSVERVVGKSQMLEKQYLRLCGPPDPALVRPEKVLIDSFHHCVEKWEREKDYRFIEEQFRSIRQDITVQGIKNSFTIKVYETNAKIALQNHDLGQFHQCQTQLYELYKQLGVQPKDREEFLCYRLLYLVLTNMNHDLLKLSGELTFEEKQLAGFKYAEHCRKALVEGNCHRFFRLSQIGPFLTSTLIAIFIKKLRVMYLVLIARAHYQITVEFLRKELQFGTVQECREFLRENNAVWVKGSDTLVDGRMSASFFEASPLLQNRKMNAMG